VLEIDKDIILCPYCGQISRIIWVHGHGQCAVCKTTVDECCRGEIIDNNEKTNAEKTSEHNEIKNNNDTEDETN
jgi:hypothetical protein